MVTRGWPVGTLLPKLLLIGPVAVTLLRNYAAPLRVDAAAATGVQHVLLTSR